MAGEETAAKGTADKSSPGRTLVLIFSDRVRLNIGVCPVLADDTCTSEAGSGTTAFQVSTGGIGLRQFTSSPDYIVKRFSDTHGWLKLTLEDDGGFSWRFMPVSGPSTDTGSRPPPT